MSKTLTDFARERRDELAAVAKGLRDQLRVVDAELAQIDRVLGKPAKGAATATPADPAPRTEVEKPARVRKHAPGSLLPEGLNPGEQAVIGKVIDGAPDPAALN